MILRCCHNDFATTLRYLSTCTYLYVLSLFQHNGSLRFNIPALEYETVEVKAGRIMRVRSETVTAKFLSATFEATLSIC